ncbi:hypothetical protein ACFL35_15510 [Candidatus Riflebacteria bacterium]
MKKKKKIIQTTPRELIDKGAWEPYCIVKELELYRVNRKKMALDETVILSEKECRKMEEVAKNLKLKSSIFNLN